MTPTLREFRARHREQELVFEMARDLTREYVRQPTCGSLRRTFCFRKAYQIVRRYIAEKVEPEPPAERIDAFLSPYYGWIIEILVQAIRPDTASGEAPEIPDIEQDRACATKDIEVWTGKEVREALHTHVNLVVNDTLVWEQSAAYLLDIHAGVTAFVKNFGLNFTIPYAYNGEPHDYLPDFVARLAGEAERYLIVEIKGADWDGRTEIKAQAATRWCAAINATGKFGAWEYLLARRVGDVKVWLDAVANKVVALA